MAQRASLMASSMALHLAAGFVSSALVATPQSPALRRLHILLIAPALLYTRARPHVRDHTCDHTCDHACYRTRANDAPTAKACYPTRVAPRARSCAARTSSRST
eukprot:scaffold111736_cov63-Phaeocystis_antarctica.AAC.1